MPADQLAGLVHVLALPQKEHEAAGLSRGQGEGDVQGRAGIEPRPEAAGQCLAAEGHRLRQGPVATQERQAVSRCRAQGFARLREGHAPRELLVVGVPGQDRPHLMVELGHHVRVMAGPRRPQDPLVVGEHAEATRPCALVREGEQGELHRVLGVDEYVQLVPQAARHASETGEPGGMPDHEAAVRSRAGHGAGGG